MFSARWLSVMVSGLAIGMAVIVFAAVSVSAWDLPRVTAVPPVASVDASASAQSFEIVPSESEARFVIDEVLAGAPKTVVGTTHEIVGFVSPETTRSNAVGGVIVIDARTFKTDSSQRDRAIQTFVLKTSAYDSVTFAPTSIEGLNDVGVGESAPMTIAGDLTIAGVARPVTFAAIVTREAEKRLSGTANTAIQYADWGLSIPQVPLVTSVDGTVQLQLDFTAVSA